MDSELRGPFALDGTTYRIGGRTHDVREEDDMTEAKYRVGMIGIGRKGAQHARAYRINPRTQIVAAADTDEENLEVFCKRFGVPGYADYHEMLKKESIDIAAPILPVGPNPAVVIGCAEAGVKGILCEKPFAPSLREADAMVAACRSNGVKIGAGDLNINLPAYQEAAKMIAEGEIGEVKSIHFFGGGGTELSGGGIQQFSLMRMFAGFAEVAWCIGWVDDDPWKDYDQGGSGYVRFVNGVEAFISRERDARGSGFQVNCAKGVFVSNAEILHMYRSPDGSSSWETMEKIEGLFPETNVIGKTSGHREPDGWLWPGDRNLASVSVFVDHLEQDLDPPGSGDNGRKVLEIAIGLRESHRRGHAPVRFPLEDRNLRMIPHASRMNYKKLQVGREAYMRQMANQVQDDLVKV